MIAQAVVSSGRLEYDDFDLAIEAAPAGGYAVHVVFLVALADEQQIAAIG